MNRFRTALFALLALTAAGYSQNGGPAPYTIQASARLVVLDVVVTDKVGNIVPSLTRDDFKVTEDGHPEKVVNFEGLGAHRVPSNLTVDSTADLKRLAPLAPVNIIVFDESNTLFVDQAYARSQLKSYLATQPAKLESPTELIAVGASKSTLLQDFTQDRDKIVTALNKHQSPYPWQAQSSSWQAERYVRTFDALQKIAVDNANHGGHKNVVWVGAGLARLSADVSGDNRAQLNGIVVKCINLLRDARITLYAVNPAGNPFTTYQTGQSLATSGASADALDPFQGSLDFARMAEATGGKALRGRNDVDVEVGTSIRDGSNLYTMSYRPGDEREDAAVFRKIRVTTTKPGLHATTREGYYRKDASRQMIQEMVVALQGTADYDAVPVSAHADAGAANRYVLHIKADDATWIADTPDGPRHADILVLASTFDSGGKELKRLVKTFRINQAPSRPATFDVAVSLEPADNASRARFVVRVDQTGQVGSADVALKQGPS